MMHYSPRFNHAVIVDNPTAANIAAAFAAANVSSREVIIREGQHTLLSGIAYTPTNHIYVRGEGRGTVLKPPSDATSPIVMTIGTETLGDRTNNNPIALLTVDGALGAYAVTVAGGHGIVQGDTFIVRTYFPLSTGAGYAQVVRCIDVSATNTLHLDAALGAPFTMGQGSYVTKLDMIPGFTMEGISFDIGGNTGLDTGALVIVNCKNPEISRIAARGFGGGTGNGIGTASASNTSRAYDFRCIYGGRFNRLSGAQCGDGGRAEFNLVDSSNCISNDYISEQASGFGCSYTRVAHCVITNHNIMAPWGRGMKLEAARFCRVSNIEVTKAGQLGLAFYGLGANQAVTGFGLAYNSGYNNLSQIVTLQCLGSGFQTMGSGNTNNKMVNCTSLFNGIVGGTNADRSAGDLNNYMHGQFAGNHAGWGTVAVPIDGNVLLEI